VYCVTQNIGFSFIASPEYGSDIAQEDYISRTYHDSYHAEGHNKRETVQHAQQPMLILHCINYWSVGIQTLLLFSDLF
jgi:hypothetical protein